MRLSNQEIQRLKSLGKNNKQLKKAWEMAVGNESAAIDNIRSAYRMMKRCATLPHIHGPQPFDQFKPYMDDINNSDHSILKLALARTERATKVDPLAKTSLRGRAFVRYGVRETNKIFTEIQQQQRARLQDFRGHDWHAHILGRSLEVLGQQRVQGQHRAWKPSAFQPVPITDEGERIAATYQSMFEGPFQTIQSGWRGTIKFTGEDKGSLTPLQEYVEALRTHRQKIKPFMTPLQEQSLPSSMYSSYSPQTNPTAGYAARVLQQNPDIEQTIISTLTEDDPFAYSMNAKRLSDVPLSIGNPERPLKFLFPEIATK